jgi:hypothetical protein
MHRNWILATLVILFAWQALGQNSDERGPSLGEIAKKNKNNDSSRSKAKRVITDDDVNVRSNPIPVIAVQGPDNTDEVLNEIREFKRTHDAAETERVVHQWFDEQSDVLSAAIEANARIAQNTQMRMEVQQDTNRISIKIKISIKMPWITRATAGGCSNARLLSAGRNASMRPATATTGRSSAASSRRWRKCVSM